MSFLSLRFSVFYANIIDGFHEVSIGKYSSTYFSRFKFSWERYKTHKLYGSFIKLYYSFCVFVVISFGVL